ncbi:MAG: response regulator [Chlorobiales bacterium]|jgi:two-component system, sensor histidine kinase and response regulator|nr:response regulator [Chlorobiales bacterium]
MSHTTEKKEQPAANQRKILVVEDNNDVRQLIIFQLRSKGYVVLDAENVGAAKLLIDKESPSIVVCDWVMPEEDGFSFCKYIRSHEKASGIYFIMLTGRSEHTERLMALQSCVDDYITKPCEAEDLLARVAVGDRMCQLQERIAALERAQAFHQMGNTIAHEINNPLTGLLGFLQLTKSRLQRKQSLDQADIDKTVETLERCIQQGQRIGDVVEKLRSRSDHTLKKNYDTSFQVLDIDSEKPES